MVLTDQYVAGDNVRKEGREQRNASIDRQFI